ncbi:MAG TPA: GTPase HflX [Bacillota bacterium]|nr:GTPase HflX [Bacillota bacterium]HOK68786.1 GTPase HflX [Bacillota bacterium]HPP84859.1 GTPase HflX [Bacillota bacterium]
MDIGLNKEIKTKAVLISVNEDMTEEQVESSLNELERLLETAGGEAVARIIQNRPSPDKATYIGSGKVKEIAEFIKNSEENIELAVFDNELSPSQIANLEEGLGVRVIDRTMLILDIFALHATTGEGKLQIEIACLRYSAPRLMGKGAQMSRLGGGIGTRGPGESKLESDRRHLKRRIAALTAELESLDKTRAVKRTAREKSGIKTAAIIGYTNAGKSTLLNYLTNAGILAEDKLFATLDPTTRRLTLPSGNEILLTDTVGFIDRLPTHLIKAFKSTLDELKYADIIINLTDASEPDVERRKKQAVTERLVEELGAKEKPMVRVFNKIDKAVDTEFIPKDALTISALNGDGIDKLLAKLDTFAADGKKTLELFFPHALQAKTADVYRLAKVISVEYTDDGTVITAECDERAQGVFKDFIN